MGHDELQKVANQQVDFLEQQRVLQQCRHWASASEWALTSCQISCFLNKARVSRLGSLMSPQPSESTMLPRQVQSHIGILDLDPTSVNNAAGDCHSPLNLESRRFSAEAAVTLALHSSIRLYNTLRNFINNGEGYSVAMSCSVASRCLHAIALCWKVIGVLSFPTLTDNSVAWDDEGLRPVHVSFAELNDTLVSILESYHDSAMGGDIKLDTVAWSTMLMQRIEACESKLIIVVDRSNDWCCSVDATTRMLDLALLIKMNMILLMEKDQASEGYDLDASDESYVCQWQALDRNMSRFDLNMCIFLG